MAINSSLLLALGAGAVGFSLLGKDGHGPEAAPYVGTPVEAGAAGASKVSGTVTVRSGGTTSVGDPSKYERDPVTGAVRRKSAAVKTATVTSTARTTQTAAALAAAKAKSNPMVNNVSIRKGVDSREGAATSSAEAEAKALMKSEWGKLDTAAKSEAINGMKQAFPGNPAVQALDPKSSTFENIAMASALAAGTAFGGPLGGAVAVMATKLFAGKLEGPLKNIAGGVKDAIADGVGGAIDAITFW